MAFLLLWPLIVQLKRRCVSVDKKGVTTFINRNRVVESTPQGRWWVEKSLIQTVKAKLNFPEHSDGKGGILPLAHVNYLSIRGCRLSPTDFSDSNYDREATVIRMMILWAG